MGTQLETDIELRSRARAAYEAEATPGSFEQLATVAGTAAHHIWTAQGDALDQAVKLVDLTRRSGLPRDRFDRGAVQAPPWLRTVSPQEAVAKALREAMGVLRVDSERVTTKWSIDGVTVYVLGLTAMEEGGLFGAVADVLPTGLRAEIVRLHVDATKRQADHAAAAYRARRGWTR